MFFDTNLPLGIVRVTCIPGAHIRLTILYETLQNGTETDPE